MQKRIRFFLGFLILLVATFILFSDSFTTKKKKKKSQRRQFISNSRQFVDTKTFSPGPFREDVQLLQDPIIGQVLEDLSIQSINRSKKLSELLGPKGLVLFIRDPSCPICKKIAPSILNLEKKYRSQGFNFANLYFHAEDPKHGNETRISFQNEVLIDTQKLWGKKLKVRSTTEAFLISSQREVIYRGAIHDQYGLGISRSKAKHKYLEEALIAHLKNETPKIQSTKAPGCLMDFETLPNETNALVQYYPDIQPLAIKSCQPCHHRGGPSPFPLLEASQFKRRKAMIKKVIQERVMPPWFASEETGPWHDNWSLSDKERAQFISWIEQDCPKGDPTLALKNPEWPVGGSIKNPDASFKAKPVKIPADGFVPYKYRYIKTNFEEDKWVSEMEILSTEPEILHHALVFTSPFVPRALLNPINTDSKIPEAQHKKKKSLNTSTTKKKKGSGKKRKRKRKKNPFAMRALKGYFAAYASGRQADRFPVNTGKKIPKGSWLVFQLHLVPNGVEVDQEVEVRFKFLDQAPERQVVTHAVSTVRFLIPAGEANMRVEADYVFKQEGELVAFMPHMHLRGKAFRYQLTFPNGQKVEPLFVPRFDFNWQLVYRLQNPIPIPKNTVMTVQGWYDNSENNPANPNPYRDVRFGNRTADEMLIGYFDWIRKKNIPSKTKK